jgi:hypothetical protein
MILQELMDACPNVGGKLLLDPCLLMRQAGQGGMGLVWKGYDVMKGRWAAVKLCGDREYWGRFYNEAHVGMTVHGEYALEIYDVRRLSKSGMPYILMEWVDGQDLQGVGRAIDLTASQIYTVALHTSRGLVAMHEKGVLHRQRGLRADGGEYRDAAVHGARDLHRCGAHPSVGHLQPRGHAVRAGAGAAR